MISSGTSATEFKLLPQLIQVALSHGKCLPYMPSADDWKQMYYEACKQAIAGICFEGVLRLPKEQQPPLGLLLQWFALAEQIKQRNRLLNARAKELTEKFAEGGFLSCVLKGQGVAELYNAKSGERSEKSGLGTYRQSGDIDLWVDGERDIVLNYAKTFGSILSIDNKHANFECFKDVVVEIHFIPLFFFNPFTNKRFKGWLSEVRNRQFNVNNLGFASPTISFNLVFSIIHINRHFFESGIGLRQLMDYYFILLHSTCEEREAAYRVLCNLEMGRFMGAVMYVLQKMFLLEEEYQLCSPSEKYGEQLMKVIIKGGNFGHSDPKNRRKAWPFIKRTLLNIRHFSRLLTSYPSEILWYPYWKLNLVLSRPKLDKWLRG